MRIVHLIDHLGLGGAQNMLVDFLEVKNPNITMSLAALTSRALPTIQKRIEISSVDFKQFGQRYTLVPKLGALRSWLIEKRPDILHTHLEYSSILGALVIKTLGKHQPKLINHLHNDPSCCQNRTLRFMARILARQNNSFISLSRSVQIRAENEFSLSSEKFFEVCPGINLTKFNSCRENHTQFILKPNPAIGTVARLAPQKGLETLLKAVALLLPKLPMLKVLIVGDGPLHASLIDYSKNLGISSSVSFIGLQEDPRTAYTEMDIFVLPSHYEGFGVVLLEAMAMGIPVIGTSVVGIVDVIQDGENGLLVSPNNAEELANAILKICNEPQLAASLTHAARNKVKLQHNREQMALEIEQIYYKTLAKNEPLH